MTYVFFQINMQPYFSLQKQKRKPKKIPTFELHLNLSCLHLLYSGARQLCVYVLGECGWRHIHSRSEPRLSGPGLLVLSGGYQWLCSQKG